MFCQFCGATIEPNLKFCTSCGRPQPVAGQPVAPAAFSPPVGIKAQTGSWIGQGWQIVKADIGTFMLMSLVFFAIASVVPMILQGPLIAGFHIVFMKKILFGRYEFGDLFKGFNFFVPALLATLVTSVFVFFGFLACIIPGLVLTAMYQFTYLFIIDKKMEFWPAMQASHAVVKNDYVGFTLFVLAASLLNMLGFLCCIVGMLVTFPILYASVTVAYKEIVGFEPHADI